MILLGTVLGCASFVRAGIIAGPDVYDGATFYLLSPDTWTNSEAEALTQIGGTLATVPDSATNQWINATFGSIAAKSNANLWLGYYDPNYLTDGTGAQHAADFRWASGAGVSFTNWRSGEPNNDPGWDGEGYANLEVATGLWNDQNNDSSGSSDFGVVETVPEPASCASIAVIGLPSILRRRKISFHRIPREII